MKIKKYDFIELDYIGKIKELNKIFDLTNEEAAKKNNLYNPNIKYSSIIICVGLGSLVKGLDDALIGKEEKQYIIELAAENAFGKKDPKLMKLVPTNIFKKQNIIPVPGLQINIDGLMGTIRTVSGGRTIIDFNHPLAGKNLIYEINIKRILKDEKEKIKSFLEFYVKEPKFELKGSALAINSEIKKQIQDGIAKKIKEIFPEIKTISFSNKESTTQKQPLKDN